MPINFALLKELCETPGAPGHEERIREIVDGRAVLPAHGLRDMPVWGYELEAQAPADQPGRAAAQGLIDRLVAYLRSIQQ